MTKHPMQPLEYDSRGVIRFKRNKIIDWLFYAGKLDLNQIAILACDKKNGFTKDDQMQLAQLLGYSVSGFGDLPYADPKVVAEADEKALKLSIEKDFL